jgi:Fanconi anemia group D2 protein
VGDRSHPAVVSALENLLQEDSQVVVAVLDTLSDLNLNAHLQEQVIVATILFNLILCMMVCICWPD